MASSSNIILKCIVPTCKNNSADNPELKFIYVPVPGRRRDEWARALNLKISNSKNLVCCEQHFDLPNDASNWVAYKMMGTKIRLKPDVVPHLNLVDRVSKSQLTDSSKKRKLFSMDEEHAEDVGPLNISSANTESTSSSSLEPEYQQTESSSAQSKRLDATGLMEESVQKKTKKSWNPDNMKAALKAIRNGGKIKAAAKNFNVPESTIRDRLKLEKNDNPSMGRKPTFSEDEEKELVDFINFMSKMFYGISQQQLRKFVYDFAVAKNVKNIFSSEKGMAGKYWVYSFLKRNPGLSLRRPERTSSNRILGVNKSEITIFFGNLEELIANHNFPARRIFNVGETSISNVQEPCKIYAPTGLKQVGKATSAELGQNVTVVCALSATGIYVPPMFIFSRMRSKASLSIGGPPGAVYECSKTGWINEELFAKWLKHFASNVFCSAQNPALLVLDNHCSHQSFNAFEFCRENGIHLLSLPPQTSHKMQPLDVTYFGPLKSAYFRECDLFMKMQPIEKITHDNIASIFNKAYTRVSSMEKAVEGFKLTGIYPLNPHIFDDDNISDPIIEQVHQTDNSIRESAVVHGEYARSLIPLPVLDQLEELSPATLTPTIKNQLFDIEAEDELIYYEEEGIGSENKITIKAELLKNSLYL